MTARTDDYDEIVRVVQLYVDGFNHNEAGKFQEAFDLASPGFWRNLGSGSEAECLHLIGILAFADEFREAVACG